MKNPIKLAIVDDHQLFRRGMASMMKECKDIRVIFEAVNGKDLLKQMRTLKPDVILMDIQMPEMDGIEATFHIRKKYPECKVVILSMHDECQLVYDLLHKGANGFLNKDADIDEVFSAIYTVSEKGYYLNERALKAFNTKLSSTSDYVSTFSAPTLSIREIEVVKLICGQYTIKEIADKLNISPRTVDTYRENIFSKTKSKNIAGVVIYAIKNNLMD
jgi:two-component system, NarL family, response regulator DegU